jgi:PAS domain S-box-containing protein
MLDNIKADPQKWLLRILPGGIRERLFLLIAVAVLPLLILLLWVYEQRYETRRIQEVQTEVEVARGIATSFEAYVQGINQQNYAIGQSIITDRSYNQEDVTLLLTRAGVHFPAIRNLSWVNPGGMVQASSLPDLVGRDLSVRPYFQQILAGQPWAIGDITQTGAATPLPTLAIATGLRDDHNALLGVVVAGIEPTRLGELALSHARPAEGEYSIFDRQGALVYNSSVGTLLWEDRVHWKEKDGLLQEVLQTGQERMGITSLPLPGGNWIAARVPISGTGFIAGAARPLTAALGPIQSDSTRDALIAFMVGLLAFLLAYLIARTISNPLHRLEQDAQQMGAGKLEKTEDPPAPKEVRSLRNTVELMATDLRLQALTAHENEERYKVLFQNRHTPMLLIDPDTEKIMDANPAASSFYGWDRDGLLRQKITDINTFTPEQTRQEMIRAATSQFSQQFFFRHRLANGDMREVEVHSGPIEINGKTYLFSIIHDVTDRKRLETEREQLIAQLDQERARWQGVVEGIADEVWTCDAQGKMSLMNLPAVPAMGLDEFKDLPYEKVLEEVEILELNGEVRPVQQAPLLRALQGQIVRGEEIMVHRESGKTRYRQYSAAPMRDASGNISGAVAIVRDVTEYKQIEQALRLSEMRLRRLFDTSVIGIMNRNGQGTIMDANEALLSMLGYTRADLEAGTFSIDHLLPDEYLLVEEQITQEVLAEGVSKPHEKELMRKDGAHVPVLVGYTRLDSAQTEIVGFVIDLTGLKEAQAALEDYAEKLKRSNQDLEQFAFVASHDLQEPLRKVKVFGDRIRNKLGESVDEEVRDYLDRMQNAAGRMQEMIRALLELSRVSTHGKAFREVNLYQVVQEVIGDLEERIRKENGQVVVGPLPVIEADPTQMQRLLQNLIGNALKYHKDDIPPVVRITAKIHPVKNQPGAVLTLTVEDNGIGFDEQYAERIFQPFQRLHGRGEYEGTGMGLAICQKIVDRHYGKISVHSKPGEGSIFMVSLPLRQPAGGLSED